jgi:CRP-like cAMP-binding protein
MCYKYQITIFYSKKRGEFMCNQAIRKTFRFFQDLPGPDLDLFLASCAFRQVPAGSTLWHEGDSGGYAVLILNGKLGLKKKAQFGKRYVIVGIHAAGSMIGECSLLGGADRSVTAEAIEATDLVIITTEHFESLLSNHPQVGMVLLRHISISTSKRLSQSYERLSAVF